MTTPKQPLATKRFLVLVDQIKQELGGGYGWISVAARRLNMHRSTLVKVLNGSRPVTPGMIDRATVALDLDPAFFRSPGVDDDHRKHIRSAQDRAGFERAQQLAGEIYDSLIQGTSPAELQDKTKAIVAELERVPVFASYYSLRRALESRRPLEPMDVWRFVSGVVNLRATARVAEPGLTAMDEAVSPETWAILRDLAASEVERRSRDETPVAVNKSKR